MKKEKNHILKQIFSFLIVSGTGWLIDFSIYLILTYFAGFNVIVANICSSIPAITLVFLVSNKKIFKNKNSNLKLKTKYMVYFGYQLLLILCISEFGEFLYNTLFDIIEIPLILSNLKLIIKIIITPITMILNFIVMKNLIEKL